MLLSWMRKMESALEAFDKSEGPALLELRPSDYVRSQILVTPFEPEPTGWIIEQVGEAVCMFSSVYPNVEGGRNHINASKTA